MKETFDHPQNESALSSICAGYLSEEWLIYDVRYSKFMNYKSKVITLGCRWVGRTNESKERMKNEQRRYENLFISRTHIIPCGDFAICIQD